MAGPYIRPTVDHLLEEEVDFELRLRKQTVDRRENLEDKKRLLRRLIMEDRKYKISYKSETKFSEEIKRISGIVEELVESLRRKFDRVLVSRLRHYLNRVAITSVENEEEALARKEACEQIESILIEAGQSIREEIHEKEESGSGKKDSGSDSWRNPDPNSAIKTKQVEEEARSKEQIGEGKDQDSKYRLINPGALVKTPRKSIRSSFESLNFDKMELRCMEGDCKCGDCEGKGARKKDLLDLKGKRNDLGRQHNESEDEGRKGKQSHVGIFGNYSVQKDTWDERLRKDKFDDQYEHKGYRGVEIRNDRQSNSESRHRLERSHRDRTPSPLNRSRMEDVRKSMKSRSERAEIDERRQDRRGENWTRRERYFSGSESDSESERRRRSSRQTSRRHRRHSSVSSSSSLEETPRYRKSRVENWNLTFTGDSRSMQVEDFLYKIKKLARHEGVNEKELLRNIHHRLKGEAYDWWFTREDRFSKWSKFEDEIRFRYGNPNRDRGIKTQIRELKQRKGETFIAYVTEVEKLNQCLQKPFSSSTLFELVWDNMRPHYRSKLSIMEIDDLEHLIKINHKIDACDPNFYRCPTTQRNDVHHIEPEDSESDSSEEDVPLRVVQKVQRTVRKSSDSPNEQPKFTSSRQEEQRRTTSIACWNCQKSGHTWRECNERKVLFCYACGRLGRTTRNCENNHPFLRTLNENVRPTN